MLPMKFKFGIEAKMFLVLFLAYAYFITGFHSANEGSALALTRSMVDYGTLSIDNYRDLASVDVSFYKNHYYSDKAPGRGFLAIPLYVTGKFLGFDKEPYVFFSMELMTAFFSALSVVLFYRFALYMKISKGKSFLLAITYGFATILWTFSKTFFAHPYSAFFNLLALFTLLRAMRESKGKRKYLIYSGISLGVALLLEYTNVAVAILFFSYYFYKLGIKNIQFIVIPFLTVSSLLLLYNYLIFGNPLNIPYNYQYSYGNILETSYFRTDYLKEGLSGLLFSTWRGLFYYSPVLLLSMVGFLYWFKQRQEKDKALPLVLMLSFAAILIFYAATPAWRGGNSFGPRYLLAVMPFLVLPMWKTFEIFGKNKFFWIIFGVLLGYSVIFSAIGSFIGPAPPENLTDPFWQQYWPAFMTGFLDSYTYQQNKSTVVLLIISEVSLLLMLLKDFFPGKTK